MTGTTISYSSHNGQTVYCFHVDSSRQRVSPPDISHDDLIYDILLLSNFVEQRALELLPQTGIDRQTYLSTFGFVQIVGINKKWPANKGLDFYLESLPRYQGETFTSILEHNLQRNNPSGATLVTDLGGSYGYMFRDLLRKKPYTGYPNIAERFCVFDLYPNPLDGLEVKTKKGNIFQQTPDRSFILTSHDLFCLLPNFNPLLSLLTTAEYGFIGIIPYPDTPLGLSGFHDSALKDLRADNPEAYEEHGFYANLLDFYLYLWSLGARIRGLDIEANLNRGFSFKGLHPGQESDYLIDKISYDGKLGMITPGYTLPIFH